MKELTQFDARRIIQSVGAAGQPPTWGAHYFSDGFEQMLDLLREDYFAEYLPQGGAAFKLVVGHYGGGKTHFLYLLREVAWKQDYVVAYVSLTPDQTPFHRLDLVYRAIAGAAMFPAQEREDSRGLSALLRATLARWRARVGEGEPLEALILDSTRELESLNFRRAMRAALKALTDDDEERAEEMLQWLSAQGYDRVRHREHGIMAGIDRSTAFSSLRSLVRWIRQAGYAGTAILFDEAERTPSLSGKQKEFVLSNLRELIDESARGTLPSAFVAYAIPDYRFFDGKTGVYEAVKSRTASMFDVHNPSGVRIDLELLVQDRERHLRSIGAKLWRIYEVAYGSDLADGKVLPAVEAIAAAVLQARFADISYRRLFVQSMVRALEEIRRRPEVRPDRQWADAVVDHFLGGMA